MNNKVLCVMGTRPEVIKMAPVVTALRKQGMETPILVTGQHRELLDQMLAAFDLRATWDLDLMEPNQRLAGLTARLIPGVARIIMETRPAAVLAQGDTTTVLCAALAAYYEGIPFGHVEAGLRSGNLRSPFPEEGNRRLTGILTQWHFAPTETAKSALLHEGVAESNIHVVGNTVIDALLGMARRSDLPWPTTPQLRASERLILITLHRRENFGLPLQTILTALGAFALKHPEARLLYPVHPNPNVKESAERILGGIPNVHLVAPLDYPAMVNALKHAFLVLTDSGGLQEEAPALGKPVLVFRDVTERPEAVEAGGVILVGSDPDLFTREADRLWNDSNYYTQIAQPRFPYGDGQSSNRIASIMANSLKDRTSQ